MDFLEIFFIAIALSMDSFSISIARGFNIKKIFSIQFLCVGLILGFFQIFTLLGGWLLGTQIEFFVSNFGPLLSFILLFIIGIKMIYESLDNSENNPYLNNHFSFKKLIFLGIATSIDAFAIGITFAVLKSSIIIPAIIIGLTSFILSEIGLIIGKKLGYLFEDKIEIIGGLILIILGIKILLEGTIFI